MVHGRAARQVGAGGFAQRRFEERHARWKRRVRPWLLVAMVPVAGLLWVCSRVWPQHASFYVGLALGCFITAYVVLLDAPPEHIDRWRRGAHGERDTATALQPLVKAGWLVEHDQPTPTGNRDHVAIGPAGVFLLDTKAPGGAVSIVDGVMHVQWLEDPEDGYDTRGLAARMRAAATRLRYDLQDQTRVVTFVYPVVVIWGRFGTEPIEADGVTYVHGSVLGDWLAVQPRRLSPGAQALLTERWTVGPPATSLNVSRQQG